MQEIQLLFGTIDPRSLTWRHSKGGWENTSDQFCTLGRLRRPEVSWVQSHEERGTPSAPGWVETPTHPTHYDRDSNKTYLSLLLSAGRPGVPQLRVFSKLISRILDPSSPAMAPITLF